MSSMLEGLYPSEETNGIAETSQNVSEGQNDAVADRDQSESTTNTDDIEFVLPVNGVVTKKHDPDLQVFSETMQDYRVHLGIDIETRENAPVYAAADGKVSKIWEDPLMGRCIAIEHAGNYVTIYKNLNTELPEGIAEGASVRSGQLIATVGESAMVEVAEAPHLHFEMTHEDLMVDPLYYINIPTKNK